MHINLDRNMFQILLAQMDLEAMRQHSQMNHHVNGLHYLCLSRTEKLTVKLYLMDKPANPNSTFLVHPHSHRYSFATMVLAGGVDHLRFSEYPDDGYYPWDKYAFDCETRRQRKVGTFGLAATVDRCEVGAQYFVNTDEIHTLVVHHGGPLLLGLVQFADTEDHSAIYLPKSLVDINFACNFMPTLEDMHVLRERAFELLGA